MNYDPTNTTPPSSSGGPLTPPPPIPPSGNRASETIDDIASTLRELFSRVPDTVNKAVERALNVRDTTVLVRLGEASSDAIDQLVAAGIYKSRSEAASFFDRRRH